MNSSTPVPVANEAARFVPGKIIKVDFDAAKATPSYDIVIGHSILTEAGALIRMRLGNRRCIIITDSNVEPLYRARLEAVLASSGHEVRGTLIIPAGEANKNFQQLQALLEKTLALGVDRKTLVIALGGGVVGDLAGLVASLVMRGLDLVQIPTTLLSQVDSSVGGKTGIDTAYGKNTVGTFYQPCLVIVDVSLLDSLPSREMRAGYAETVKYGLIDDAAFFRWCTTHGEKILRGDPEAQIQAVGVSCASKAKIVAADEREAGKRALLNLGHTFGHALEAATGYGTLLVHGEAVSIGIVMAFALSVRLGLCPEEDYKNVRAHFAAVGLPVALPKFAYNLDNLMGWMAQDKKSSAGNIVLILVRGIGQAFVVPDVEKKEVIAVWKEFIQS